MVRLKKLNILLLEDNLEFAKNMLETLELFFKNVYHSTNVKEALSIYKEMKIDVIISDIKVENGNGLNFIETIRAYDNETPIAILSAHKDEEFLFKAIGLNILSYDLKPLSYNAFLKLLEKISTKFNTFEDIDISDTLRYSFSTKMLYEDNAAITLTKKEALLVELLLKNKNKILTNQAIQRDVYEGNIMSEAAIKNLLLRLRKKVTQEFIYTIHNLGYRLTSDI